MKRIPVSLLGSLMRFTAGDNARRTLPVGSARYTFNRYVLAEDAKRGEFYRKATVKHHALITDSCMIVAAVVTDGNAGDSPAPARLCTRAPHGEGTCWATRPTVPGRTAGWPRQSEGSRASGPRRVLRPATWASGAGCWPGAGTAPAGSTGRMAAKHDRELLLGGQGPIQFQDQVRDAGDATTRDRHHGHLPESLCLIGDKKSPASTGTRGGAVLERPDPADDGVFTAGDTAACHRGIV